MHAAAAERRLMDRALLTLLFTDLVGSTELFQRLGDEGGGALLRTYFSVLREATAMHGGQEVKTLGDGMMIAFETAEDAFECAVSIQRTLELRNQTGAAELGVRIGVNTGEVIREEGDYFGMAVVLAKRLCDRASGGQILVSERAHGADAARVRPVRDLGVLSLKGVADPVRVFELSWQEARERPDAMGVVRLPQEEGPIGAAGVPLPGALAGRYGGAFLGRSAEADRVSRAALQPGLHRDLMLLAGDPGVGKTRFLAELAERAVAGGALVLYGHSPEEGLAALQPFIEALSHFLAHVQDDGFWAALAADPTMAELVPFLPELARVLHHDQTPVEDVDTGRFRLFDAARRLIDLISARWPVVLLLDDLHWADKQSLLLLKYVARADERGRLLVVCAYRPSDVVSETPLARTLPDLRRIRGVEEMHFEGLREGDVRALIKDWAGSDPSPELVRGIHRDTQGNPFFIREVLRHLLTTGTLREQAGHVTSTIALDAAGVPEGVRKTIERRLAQLGEQANEALSVGAVIGKEFDLRTIRRVSSLPLDTLLEALDEATAAKIVTEIPGREPAYSFEHALTRETLYARIPGGTKIRLHNAIADAVESLYAPEAGPHVTQIADHLLLSAGAADLSRTVDYAMRAGEYALGRLAFEDGADFYRRALALLDETKPSHMEPRCNLLLLLAESERRAGEQQEARAAFASAAEIAKQLGSSERLAVAALGYGGVGFGAMWFGEGKSDEFLLNLLEEAREALGKRDIWLRARLLTRSAQEMYWSPMRDKAAPLSREAVAIARRLGNPAELAAALIGDFSVLLGPDNIDERARLADEALPLAEQAGDGDLVLRTRAFRAMIHGERGDRDALDAEIAEYMRLADTFRQAHHLWYARVLQAAQAMLDGKFDDVERLSKLALDLGKRGNDRNNAFLFFGGQILSLRMLQGRGQELEASLKGFDEQQSSLQGFEEEYPSLPVWRAALAHLYSEADRKEEARSTFDSMSKDGFAYVANDAFGMNALASLVLVCVYLGDADAARSLYERLVSHAGRYVWIPPALGTLGPVSFHLGLLAGVMRRQEETLAHFADALTESERMRDRPWNVMSQFAFAVTLLLRRQPGDVERAHAILAEARTGASEMGLRSPLDRPLIRMFLTLADELGLREEIDEELSELGARGSAPDEDGEEALGGKIRAMLRRLGVKQISKMVRNATDEELNERFGSRPMQRALLTAIAMSFDAEKAYGFEGTISYELTRAPASNGALRESDHWTINVVGGKATARRGHPKDPKVSLRLSLADFVRVVAGHMNPIGAVLDGAAEVEGDMTVASRLVEMFGGPEAA